MDDDHRYHGHVYFYDLQGRKHEREVIEGEPLAAVLAAEEMARTLLAEQDLPPWGEEALRLGWHPPSKGEQGPLHVLEVADWPTEDEIEDDSE